MTLHIFTSRRCSKWAYSIVWAIFLIILWFCTLSGILYHIYSAYSYSVTKCCMLSLRHTYFCGKRQFNCMLRRRWIDSWLQDGTGLCVWLCLLRVPHMWVHYCLTQAPTAQECFM